MKQPRHRNGRIFRSASMEGAVSRVSSVRHVFHVVKRPFGSWSRCWWHLAVRRLHFLQLFRIDGFFLPWQHLPFGVTRVVLDVVDVLRTGRRNVRLLSWRPAVHQPNQRHVWKPSATPPTRRTSSRRTRAALATYAGARTRYAVAAGRAVTFSGLDAAPVICIARVRFDVSVSSHASASGGGDLAGGPSTALSAAGVPRIVSVRSWRPKARASARAPA